MDYTETRIAKLRTYLFGVLDTLTTSNKYQLNADFLSDIGNYSLDKIPTENEVEKWINGLEIHRDVYSLRSRKAYSSNEINNLSNIGFFEQFENIIKSNNRKGVLPSINGIQSIECLNCGTLNNVSGSEATFDIQIQITYKVEKREEISL